MSFYDVYVGLLEDPEFKWDGGDYNGNTPKMLTSCFPKVRTGTYFDIPVDQIFDMARDLPDSKAKQFDWGASGVKVQKEELIELCREWYQDHPDELEEALKLYQGLLQKETYVIVAMES